MSVALLSSIFGGFVVTFIAKVFFIEIIIYKCDLEPNGFGSILGEIEK